MPTTSFERYATAQADLAACRATLCGGSRSFYAASFFLPRRLREPAAALYAFCRVADDAIDNSGGCRNALAALRERLERIYAGQPLPFAEDRALADVVVRFGIPRVLLEALLEGFEWDAQGRRYMDLSGVMDYSARVAGTIGAMMAALMDARSPDLVARACDLGVAMQLTNIARDVGEDARNGRIYLPLNWLRDVGIDPDVWLKQPSYNTALGQVVERLLQTADVLYRRSDSGISGLPSACRSGIYAARFLYAEIGQELRRQGLNSVTQRAVVPATRKVRLLSRVPIAALGTRNPVSHPPLEETRYLVDAVAASRSADMPNEVPMSRVVWVLDLFERMEQRDRRPFSPPLIESSAG